MRKLDREIAVLGSTSVGKSALSIRFVRGEFSTEYDPTIFKRYTLPTTVNGVEYNLVLYDTAGLEQQAQISYNLLRSNGFILVYSIADPQSFEIVKSIYYRIADELMTEKIPIVLVGNKSDLADKRQVTFKQGQELADSINAEFFETSARTGDNVRESFFRLLDKIDNRHSTPNNNTSTNTTNNNVNDQQQQQKNTATNNSTTTNSTNRTTTNPQKSNCIIS